MPRRLRFIPEPDTLVEITCRVIQGRMLLRPERRLDEAIVGILAVAKRRYGVQICAVVVLSNHLHLLVVVDDAQQLARFQGFVSAQIAREASRATRWKAKVWGRRYTAIVVSREASAQLARLEYLLSHGVKEHLVSRCTDWPGVHAARSLLSGDAMTGFWFDRTAEYNARRRAATRSSDPYAHASLERLELDPLPCWRELTDRERRARVAEMIRAIETRYAAERRRLRLRPMGRKAVLRQSPWTRVEQLETRPTPLVHAASRSVRRAFLEAYRWFVEAYRRAAEKLKAGDNRPRFPHGCFPPALPFVSLAPTR